MKKRDVIIHLLIIILLSSFFALKTSYFQGHDLDFHLSRIISIKECISMKKICYVAPNYLGGYGYGTPLFYPELFLIIPSLLLYLGMSLTTSYKIFIFLINALSIISMYFCVNKITKSKEKASFSAFLYAFASYRIIDLTTRGALGEALSFMFFPIVILGIYEIIYGDYKKYKYLIIGMSGLILCHLLSSVIIFIYLVILCLINIKKLFKDKKRIKYLILSALITFLLTSYFTLPMLEQLFSSTYKLSMESTILKDRAMNFYHLFLEAPFIPIVNNIWSPGTVGTIFIIIIILYIITIIKKEKYSSFMSQNMIISLLFMLFTTKVFPWQLFQHTFYVIQFPWRLNIIPTMLLPIIGPFVLSKFKNDYNFFIYIIIMIGVFSIQSITVYKDVHYVNKNNYKGYDIMWEDYLPVSLNSYYIKNRNDVISSNKDLEYTYTRKNNVLIIKFDNNNQNTTLELPFVYYKGYSAYIDKNKLDVHESVNGLVETTIDKSIKSGIIKVFYEGTFIQKFTRYISMITFIIYILFKIKKLKIR